MRFDRFNIVLGIAMVLLSTAVIVLLRCITPSTTIHATVQSAETNCIIPDRTTGGNPREYLESRIWLEKVRLDRFGRIETRVSPSSLNAALSGYCDGTDLIIVPHGIESTVSIIGGEGSFSMQDIFISGETKLAWKYDTLNPGLVLRQRKSMNRGSATVVFSSEDETALILSGCDFLDHTGRVLRHGEEGKGDTFRFRTAASSPTIRVTAGSDGLDIGLTVQPGEMSANAEIMKSVEFSSVDFLTMERSADARLDSMNSVHSGTVARPAYNAGDTVKIHAGEYIVASPSYGVLKSFRAGSGGFQAELAYSGVHSLQVGQDVSTRHELVLSLFDLYRNDPVILAIFALSNIFIAVAARFIAVRNRKSE